MAASTSTKRSSSLTVLRKRRAGECIGDVKVLFAHKTSSIGRLLAVDILEGADLTTGIKLEVGLTSDTDMLVEGLTV